MVATILEETEDSFLVQFDKGPAERIVKSPETERLFANLPRKETGGVLGPVTSMLSAVGRGVADLATGTQTAPFVPQGRQLADVIAPPVQQAAPQDVVAAEKEVQPEKAELRLKSDEESRSLAGEARRIGSRVAASEFEARAMQEEARKRAFEAADERIQAQRGFQDRLEEIELLEPIRQGVIRAKRDRLIEEQAEARRQAEQDIGQLNKEVREFREDPNRIFRSESGEISFGRQVLASFSVALGSIGQALAGGGRNTALDIINTAIDRDINAQRSEAEKLRGLLAEKRNLWQRTEDLFDKEIDRVDAMRIAGLEDVKTQIDRLSLGLSSQNQIAQAQQFKSDIVAQQAQIQGQMTDRAARTRLEALKAEAALTPRPVGAVDPAFDLSAQGLQQIGGASKKSFEDARLLKENYDIAKNALDRLIKLRGRFGVEKFPFKGFKGTDVQQDMKELGTAVINARRKMESTGANFTKNEEELVGLGVLRSPEGFDFAIFEDRIFKRLVKMRDQLDERANTGLRTKGYVLGTSQAGITGIEANPEAQ